MVGILKSHTIRAIGEQLKLPKSTIRYWERAFEEFIRPNRTEGGQRRYTVKDAAVIETIRDLKMKGFR
jgi:UDP-N-acetylglucosamine 4,6-dehydratase